jgi:hypothetical protein
VNRLLEEAAGWVVTVELFTADLRTLILSASRYGPALSLVNGKIGDMI